MIPEAKMNKLEFRYATFFKQYSFLNAPAIIFLNAFFQMPLKNTLPALVGVVTNKTTLLSHQINFTTFLIYLAIGTSVFEIIKVNTDIIRSTI